MRSASGAARDGPHMVEEMLGHRVTNSRSAAIAWLARDEALAARQPAPWSGEALERPPPLSRGPRREFGFRRARRLGLGRARRRHDRDDFASDRDFFGSRAGCSRPLFAAIAPMLPQGERRRDAVAARRDPERGVARIADIDTADVARIVSDLECADAVALRARERQAKARNSAGRTVRRLAASAAAARPAENSAGPPPERRRLPTGRRHGRAIRSSGTFKVFSFI